MSVELRMECIRIAAARHDISPHDALSLAAAWYGFVTEWQPRMEPEDTREPRRFMDEPADAEPAWKRAKVGSWIKAYLPEAETEVNAEVIDIRSVSNATTPCFKARRFGGEVVYVTAERITAVFPTPPRHGDFGSMGEGA